MNTEYLVQPGMTLRQWYKGMALQGLLNRQYLNVPVCPKCKTADEDPGKHYAEIAGAYADAMLQEDYDHDHPAEVAERAARSAGKGE